MASNLIYCWMNSTNHSHLYSSYECMSLQVLSLQMQSINNQLRTMDERKTVIKPVCSIATPIVALRAMELFDLEELAQFPDRLLKTTTALEKLTADNCSNNWFNAESVENKMKMLQMYQMSVYFQYYLQHRLEEDSHQIYSQIKETDLRIKKKKQFEVNVVSLLRDEAELMRKKQLQYMEKRHKVYHERLYTGNPLVILEKQIILMDKDGLLFNNHSHSEQVPPIHHHNNHGGTMKRNDSFRIRKDSYRESNPYPPVIHHKKPTSREREPPNVQLNESLIMSKSDVPQNNELYEIRVVPNQQRKNRIKEQERGSLAVQNDAKEKKRKFKQLKEFRATDSDIIEQKIKPTKSQLLSDQEQPQIINEQQERDQSIIIRHNKGHPHKLLSNNLSIQSKIQINTSQVCGVCAKEQIDRCSEDSKRLTEKQNGPNKFKTHTTASFRDGNGILRVNRPSTANKNNESKRNSLGLPSVLNRKLRQ